MVQPQIGIGSNNQSSSSTYDAVDLLGDGPVPSPRLRQTPSSDISGRYTIDSDGEEESTDEDASEEDDDDLSEEEDSEDDDSEIEMGNENSSAVTEVVSNLLKHPHSQHHSSPHSVVRGNIRSGVVPPASSFQNIGKRFPSYLVKGGKGKHERLATTDEDATYDDVESNSRKALMKDPINNIRDPSQFPIEQYTDGAYGFKPGQDDYSYSYATSDPSNVEYNPTPLHKMQIKGEKESKIRFIIFWGLLTAVFICFIIALSSIISHITKDHVKPPPSNLEDMCDIANIANFEGFVKCDEACDAGKCCMAPGDLSCFNGQEQVCGMVSFIESFA